MNSTLRTIFNGYDASRDNLSEDHCGPGSTLFYTKTLRENLVPLLKKYNISSMLDAPCGDFQWMSQLNFPVGFDYLGADLHDKMIDRNKRLYKKSFIVLDITDDPLPAKDLMFVRDCLFHLTDELKLKFFRNLLRTDFKYLLTSVHPRIVKNQNVSSNMNGHFHENVNWNLSPWNFPLPIDLIVDYEDGNPNFFPYPYREMHLWTYEQIKTAISKIIKEQI